MVLVGHGDEDGGEHRPAHLDQPGARDAGEQAGQADGDAHAREGAPAGGGQGVVAAARAHRAEVLVTGHEGLVDGAGVVVQSAGDLQIGDESTRTAARDRKSTL